MLMTMMMAVYLLGGCGAANEVRTKDPETVKAMLIERLGSQPNATVLGMAAVDTPEGLWNVHVLSQPPDKVLVYQIRQDGHAEFGTDGDLIWRRDPFSGEAEALPESYRYFLHSHELMRLGDRLAQWHALDYGETSRAEDQACTELELIDEFGNTARLCLGEEGLPLRISLNTPEIYGDETIHVLPVEWRESDGRTYLAIYHLLHGEARYRWNFQGLGEVDPASSRIEPPEGLKRTDR